MNKRPLTKSAISLAWPEIISAWVRPVGDVEITLPNSQGNQSFRSVAGKRSSGRAVYLGDPRLALQGRSPVGAENWRSRRLAQSPQVLCFLGKCSPKRGSENDLKEVAVSEAVFIHLSETGERLEGLGQVLQDQACNVAVRVDKQGQRWSPVVSVRKSRKVIVSLALDLQRASRSG